MVTGDSIDEEDDASDVGIKGLGSDSSTFGGALHAAADVTP